MIDGLKGIIGKLLLGILGILILVISVLVMVSVTKKISKLPGTMHIGKIT